MTPTQAFVARFRAARLERRWSARRLADRCAELGMPALTRVKISKIESGARSFLTFDEATTLSQALDIDLAVDPYRPPVEPLSRRVDILSAIVSTLQQALYPMDPSGLPLPIRRNTDRPRGMDGLYWEHGGRTGWSIGVLDDPDALGHIYVHTPQGMGWDPGDVIPVDPDTALWLAGAWLAARTQALTRHQDTPPPDDQLAAKRANRNPETKP